MSDSREMPAHTLLFFAAVSVLGLAFLGHRFYYWRAGGTHYVVENWGLLLCFLFLILACFVGHTFAEHWTERY